MKIKKVLNYLLEIVVFLFALAVFCYSGYKIAKYYHLLPSKFASAEDSCGYCPYCWNDQWKSEFCQKIKEWCDNLCKPCKPSPTPIPPTFTPTPTEPLLTPTQPPLTPTPTTPQFSPTSTPLPTQPISTPTGFLTPNPKPASPPSVGGTTAQDTGTGGQAFPCVPPLAPQIPTLLSATPISNTEIKLIWNKVDRATHYVVAYGEAPGVYIYGNSNVGDTESYTVGNLMPNKTYYFVIAAAIGGDCPVSSPFSNELSAKTKTGLVAGILSKVTPSPKTTPSPEGELGEGISTQAGEVAGVSKGVCPFWWISLLGQTLILAGFYGYLLFKNIQPKYWWLVAPIVFILGYLLDKYAHTHWYTPSKMCPWEKWLGIVLASIQTIGYKYLSNQKLSKPKK